MSDLTGLQRAFVNEWFKDFNGTRAAERAGYQGNDNALAVIASQNLRKPKIQAEIEKRWDGHGATASEVMSVLARQMRTNPADFFNDRGMIDMEKVKDLGSGVVKSVTIRKGSRVEVQVESSQRAAELIGKSMGLFMQKVALTDPTGEKEFSGFSDEERLRRIEALLSKG